MEYKTDIYPPFSVAGINKWLEYLPCFKNIIFTDLYSSADISRRRSIEHHNGKYFIYLLITDKKVHYAGKTTSLYSKLYLERKIKPFEYVYALQFSTHKEAASALKDIRKSLNLAARTNHSAACSVSVIISKDSNSMEYKVELPCSPLVREYLHKNFGNPVRLTSHSPVGKFFYALIDHPRHNRDTEYAGYKTEVTAIISQDRFERNGVELTKTAIIEINNMITAQVYGLMYVAIESREQVQGKDFKIIDSIKWFWNYLGFSPDSISLDAAKKSYYRFRERRDK